jgi:hypothetical protein
MRSNKVKPRHLSEYVGKDLEDIKDNGMLFEALAEMIVELNEVASIGNLADEYEESEATDPEEFASEKFEMYVHEDTYEVISYAHRNKWVQYTVQGLVESGVADPEHLE